MLPSSAHKFFCYLYFLNFAIFLKLFFKIIIINSIYVHLFSCFFFFKFYESTRLFIQRLEYLMLTGLRMKVEKNEEVVGGVVLKKKKGLVKP